MPMPIYDHVVVDLIKQHQVEQQVLDHVNEQHHVKRVLVKQQAGHVVLILLNELI